MTTTSGTRFDPGLGKRGKAFVLMLGIQLLPDGELVWQEIEQFSEASAAQRAMTNTILERMGCEGVVTPYEASQLLKQYTGPPIMIVERKEVIRDYAGYTAAALDAA